MKNNDGTKVYTLEHKLCDEKPGSANPDSIWDNAFSFCAISDIEAVEKGEGWARYHGFDLRDIRTRPATEHEARYNLHNEWVR